MWTEECKFHSTVKRIIIIIIKLYQAVVLIILIKPRLSGLLVLLSWLARCMYSALSGLFLCVNVVCAALGDRAASSGSGARNWNLVLVRVLVNDLLFILDAVLLAALLLLLTRHSRSTSPYLISKVCY